MKEINVEQLGRVGVGIAERAKAVIEKASKWLDEDTIESLKEESELKEES